jgi:phosphoglycolate phosphatase
VKPIRLVAFDLDGTLIDSDRDIAQAVNATLRDLGLPLRSLAEIRTMIGRGARDLLARAMGSEDPAAVEAARARFVGHYAAAPVEHTTLFPGVIEMLVALREAGLSLAVATNKPIALATVIIRQIGLEAAGISAVAAADEVPERKPDPAVLALARQRACPEATPDQTVYVGDMGLDIDTARAFGATAVGVLWGFAPDSVRERSPDLLIERPSELVAWLKRARKAESA